MACVPISSSIHLWPFPQKWERLGLFLPRPILKWAEIHARPRPLPEHEIQSCLEFWRPRKVALVKQTAYAPLYSETGHGNWVKTALSSACHLGPLSFLSELHADYHIVRQDHDPTTFLWKEMMAYDPDPLASTQHRLKEIQDLENSPVGRALPYVDDISWDQYDLVIGLDVPIPPRITQKCPHTLWAYYSLEAGGPLQKKSLSHPVEGYQLFLNHGFRRYRGRPHNRPHVLEFPLQFQSGENWRALSLAFAHSDRKEKAILVERHSRESPDPSSRLPLTYMTGKDSLSEYLTHLLGARFAIQTTQKSRWGNWAVETVLAGALFIGNASSLAMLSPLLPGLNLDRLDPAVSLANYLADHPDLLIFLQKLQHETVEEVCFRRPLADLTHKARLFFS